MPIFFPKIQPLVHNESPQKEVRKKKVLIAQDLIISSISFME